MPLAVAPACFLLLVTSECVIAGGYRGGGGGYRSAPAPRPYSPPSRPSIPARPQPSSGGWSLPQTPPRSSNAQPSAPPQQYGWQKTIQTPKPTAPPPTSRPSSYGWQNNQANAPKPAASPSTSRPSSYGWQNNQANAAKPTAPPPTSQTTSYGWQNPRTPQVSGVKPPNNAITTVRTLIQHDSKQQHAPTPAPSYGWRQPSTATPLTAFQNNRPQTTPNRYNTGPKYEKGYSKGYDQGYQRGVQQATRVNPVYYPPQNHYGYPGQGINSAYGSPTYNGMSMYGSSNNYGYPVSNAYGYQTYGTGNHDFRNGLLLGVAGGYLLNSALHPSRSLFASSSFGSHQNPWGYSGGGYGSEYQYTRTDSHTVINNYFNNPKPDIPVTGSNEPDHGPTNWVQCVAFDPMTSSTLTNPNCTCTVKVETDSATNSSVASHTCNTIWGHRVEEKTPVGDAEVFDMQSATSQASNPEKLRHVEEERRRLEAYSQIEKLVSMGSFVG